MKLWNWLKNLLLHKHSSDSLSPEEIKDVAIAEKEPATGKAKTFETAEDLLADLYQRRSKDRNLWPDTGTHRRGIPLPKASQKATRQDVGKFMKHGHQAPWYRKSVKAKVQPEEEED